MIDEAKLREINRKRKEAGRRELSIAEARRASDAAPRRDESFDFLIGYTTGVAMPSLSGVTGALLHHSMDSSSHSSPGHSYSSSSSSYDSGSSSSSYDSGSSSWSSD